LFGVAMGRLRGSPKAIPRKAIVLKVLLRLRDAGSMIKSSLKLATCPKKSMVGR